MTRKNPVAFASRHALSVADMQINYHGALIAKVTADAAEADGRNSNDAHFAISAETGERGQHHSVD